jgi:hypothetical protein
MIVGVQDFRIQYLEHIKHLNSGRMFLTATVTTALDMNMKLTKKKSLVDRIFYLSNLVETISTILEHQVSCHIRDLYVILGHGRETTRRMGNCTVIKHHTQFS